MRTLKTLLTLLAVTLVLALAVTLVWFLFFQRSARPSTANIGTFEGTQNTTSGSSVTGTGSTATNGPNVVTQQGTAAQIEELNAGPVAGVTLIDIGTPTTTIARYAMADTGHVFDLPVDVPGAAPQPVSNTTIPGLNDAAWGNSGAFALFQYLDSGIIKTLVMSFSPATTTASTPPSPHIQFLPDNIVSFAIAPKGNSVSYLLGNSGGVEGYVATSQGTNSKPLFSLPLAQVLLSWPADNELMVVSKEATGVPGIAFSINAKTGAASQLLYANGLSANASPGFAYIVYTTSNTGDTNRAVYAHTVLKGTDVPLSFQPLPEQCVWSPISSVILYCATPLAYTPANYLDLWHQGTASSPDSIIEFNVATGQTAIIATPGQNGGSPADIRSIAISPDDTYLVYIRKGDESLWSVRLTQ